MAPFVIIALKVCDELHIMDKQGQGIVMKFAKIYPPEKIGLIKNKAKSYYWWESNPKIAFMKAVGEINREEKNDPGGKESIH